MHEIEGLDIPEMGVLGYPDVVLSPAGSEGHSIAVDPAVARPALRPATDRT